MTAIFKTKGLGVRTYFETLLHRKRGEYGPLWLFELDPETWAIVWEECLDHEDACRMILSEDTHWFNQEWGNDGRRPNPTYKTAHLALEEITRLLKSMMETGEDGDVKRSQYAAYAALAQYHLHMMTAEAHSSRLHGGEAVAQPFEPVSPENEVQPVTEQEQTSSARAAHDGEPKKPWEVASTEPTGSNFKPELPLHAKMEWVCDNVPKMSKLRILREGAALLCEQLIEKHYKG
ncbi:hypothetical protein DNF23_51270 [Pseudomonas syringae pv. pisi]